MTCASRPTVANMRSAEIRLGRRPDGAPALQDFEPTVREIAEPGDGAVVVRLA